MEPVSWEEAVQCMMFHLTALSPEITSLFGFFMVHNEGAKPEIVFNQESDTLEGGREHLKMRGSALGCNDNFRALFIGL